MVYIEVLMGKSSKWMGKSSNWIGDFPSSHVWDYRKVYKILIPPYSHRLWESPIPSLESSFPNPFWRPKAAAETWATHVISMAAPQWTEPIARASACALNFRGKPFDSRTSNWSQTNIGMHIRKNPPNCLDRDFHHPVCDQWSMAIKTPPTFNCSGTICGVAWTRCWLNTGVVYCIWSYELFDHVKCIKKYIPSKNTHI
jgi:hypothetical protein